MTATQQRKEFNALHVEAAKRDGTARTLYEAGRYDEAVAEWDTAARLRIHADKIAKEFDK